MSMVRQPVPGVHDLISPEGRVCVELIDERGRVRHTVRSENAIMNFWNEAQKRVIRGADPSFLVTQQYAGYHFHGATVSLASEIDSGRTLSDWYVYGLAAGWPVIGHPMQFQDSMRNVILTDSTDTVDPDEFIFPGNLTAFTNLREQYAPSTSLKRGNLNTTTSYRTTTSLRYVSEWGTAYGNGTHNSVGIGSVVSAAASATFAHQAPSPYLNALSLKASTFQDGMFGISTNQLNHSHPMHNSNGTGRYFAVPAVPLGTGSNVAILSGFRVATDEFWCVQSGTAANNMARRDHTVLSAPPFDTPTSTSGLTVTGPTNTTIGSGTNKTGVAVIGSDLWLAYQGTLKRCVKPTSTALTVTNTYTPGGIETCVDITTDGTDIYWLGATTVYKINPAAGTITSSWAHGLTGTMGTIAWGGTNSPYLMIGYDATGLGSLSTMPGITARTMCMSALFTTAGVNKGAFAVPGAVYSTTASTMYQAGGLIMPLTGDNKHWVGPWTGNAQQGTGTMPSYFGPSHMSRTVLGSPVVKTSSFSMRVTYEFTF